MTVMLKAAHADIPAYSPSGNECALFATAWTRQLPLLLKGPPARHPILARNRNRRRKAGGRSVTTTASRVSRRTSVTVRG